MGKLVKLEFINKQEINYQLKNCLVVFFCLSGNLVIETNEDKFRIDTEGVIVVNPLTAYRCVCGNGSWAVSLTIESEILKKAGWNNLNSVSCCITDAANQMHQSNEIRGLLSKLMQDCLRDDEKDNHKNIKQDAIELVKKFLLLFSYKTNIRDLKTKQLLARILARIEADYCNPNLTIQLVAEQEYISTGHLARLFQSILHTTFTKYLTAVRLKYALDLLMHDGRSSVTFIAEESGFKSVNAFISYFRRLYGITPGQYRIKQSKEQKRQDEIIDFQPILKYGPTLTKRQCETINVAVDITKSAMCLQHNWKKILNIGYAREGLSAVVQRQIVQAQRDIGFESLRIHGIFDDDMHIYQENEDGSPWYNFLFSDLLLDFIVQTGLEPYLELGYMPSKLAKHKCRLFDRNSIFSIYNNSIKWVALVQAAIAHWIDRYGLQQVRKWHFAMIGINYVYLGEIPLCEQEYYEWYKATYFAIKKIDADLNFGAPSFLSNLENWPEKLHRFIQYTQQENCVPDFICAQCHPHDSMVNEKNFLRFTRTQEMMPSTLSDDTEYTTHFLNQCREVLKNNNMNDIPLIVDEWNSTLWQRDLSGDTCYKAAWIFKNVLENYDTADKFGYYLLSDYIEEWMLKNSSVFHGSYGLLTINGIPKPGYYAMNLLCKIGNKKIDGGPGWFISTNENENSIQIFLYHYCHYNVLYRQQYQRLRNPRDAYSVFEEQGDLQIQLQLEGIEPGNFREESYTISREHGSAFDQWIMMGAPNNLSQSDIEYLSTSTRPLCAIREFVHMNSKLDMHFSLKPHEVKLIVLRYQYF